MPALSLKKNKFLLVLFFLLAVGAVGLLNFTGDPESKIAAQEHSLAAAALAQAPQDDSPENASDNLTPAERHALECSHCAAQMAKQAETGDAETDGQESSSSVPHTQAKYDSIFEKIQTEEIRYSRSDFDFLKGIERGTPVDFELADRKFSGEVALVREGQRARAYTIKFPEGDFIVTVNTLGKFQALLMLGGDSRVVEIAENSDFDSEQTRTDASRVEDLITRELSMNEVICAPGGAVHPLIAPQPDSIAALAVKQSHEETPLENAAAISLTDEGTSGHVVYLNFEGETVTGDHWNIYTGRDVINAAPAPRVNDQQWVTNVWKRVVEDFVPFNVTVTTDRSVYEAANEEERLHVIITPSSAQVAPGTGGVAFLNSYNTNLTRIVWTFNLSEYTCADTISHEAGHAFGLNHHGLDDGNTFLEYYPGHNGSYTPGWGPIMGATFIGGTVEVTQWARGEYQHANRSSQDDIAMIARAANGFGMRPDDFASVFTGSAGLEVGILSETGPNQAGATGLISHRADRDVFRFSVAFDGGLTMTVSPLDVQSADPAAGSDTRGANLAVATRLLDASGNEIAVGEEFGDVLLESRIEAPVAPGIYYVEVSGAGRGANPTTGFSDYGSMGQYTIFAELPTQPLSVFGGPDKMDRSVLLGDTSTSVTNGTDYGFSFPGNVIVHTFLLQNNGSNNLENLTVTLASGEDFEFVGLPAATIAPGTADFLHLAYVPKQTGVNGVDNDTVTIEYDTNDEAVTFDFAVSGTATPSATRDNYSDNHSFNRAYDLRQVEGVWLSDYKGRAFFMSHPHDWYTFNAANGSVITVDVAYNPSDGPINFELVNAQNRLIGSTTEVDGRIQFLIPHNYPSINKPFYIRATSSGDSSVRNAYDLRWTVTAPTPNEDFYAPNNSQDTAFDLTGASSPRLSEYLGKAILNEESWFKIEIPADPFARMLYVRAEYEHAEGNIDIEIIPPDTGLQGYFYGLSGQAEDYEVLTYFQPVILSEFAGSVSPAGGRFVMGLEPGTYFIRVTGDYAGNEYDLVVEAKRNDAYQIVDPFQGTENNTIENAASLGESIVGTWLSEIDGVGVTAGYNATATQEEFVYLDEIDWYRFTIPAGTSVGQLQLEFDTMVFDQRIFRIHRSDGEVLASSDSNNGNPAAQSGPFETISAENPVGSLFYISVTGFSALSSLTPYDFRVNILADTVKREEIKDDNYENNDRFDQLYNLSHNAGLWLTAVDGYGVQLDPDWFQITVPKNAAQLRVMTRFDSSLGNMGLTLSRKNGPVLFRAQGTGAELDPEDPFTSSPQQVGDDSRTIIWNNPDPGQYAVTITGQNRGNIYNLFWDYSLAEDAYEVNNTRATAFDLTGHEKQLLSKLDGPGVQNDDDWYRISAPAGTAQLQVLSTFSHTEGDIDLEVYNSSGFIVGRSTSVTDDESITIRNPAPGDYFVRVYFGNAGNEYDLWWGAFTQDELDNMQPDAYQPNNSASQATPLPSHTFLSEINGLGTQLDEDWFAIEISDSSLGFMVECSFTHAEGDIDIEVIDSLGTVVTRSISQTDNESILYNASLPGGTYYIRVFGANLGNSYDLYWADFREDAFEPNDSFETAYDITELRQRRLSEVDVPTQGDDDWYRFTADQPDSIFVIELTHTNPQGSISFELYDSNQNLLASDLSTDDVKYLQMLLPSTGEFFIRVFGDNAYNEYDFFWNALPDDPFEDNDIRDDAYDISGDEGVALEGVVFDDDWFVVDPPYGVVNVELSVAFEPAFGELGVSVYNHFGEPVIQIPSATDGQTVTFDVNPFNEGVTYIKVYGVDGNYGNPYTLTWRSIVRDIDEDNDTLETATDLTGLEGVPLSESGGFDTSADEDWFMIQPSAENLIVFCRFDHAAGNIDIELFDRNGLFLERSISETDNELIERTVTPGEIYYVRVFGESAGNPYDLVYTSYETDDIFEDNDTLATAANFLPFEYRQQNNLIQLDDDWYEVQVGAGDELLFAEISPSSRIDRMVLGLYDAGEVLLDAVTTADGENRLEVESLAPGSYYLRVSGRNIGGRYSLVWSSGRQDNYEVNTTAANAFDLSATPSDPLSAIDGLGTQYDEDWYSVTLTADNSALLATLDFVHEDGDLSLTVYDENEAQLAVADGTTDRESISLFGLDAGVYYILVNGPNYGTEYDLEWDTFTDDNYESNGSFDEAYDLGDAISGTLSAIDGLGVRGNNDDFYVLTIPFGHVTLEVICTYAQADGNITVEIFNEDEERLGSADTPVDDEVLTVPVNPNGGKVYIVVSGADGLGTTYDLDWAFDREDLYEDNDTFAEAADITTQQGTLLSEFMGYATQTDPDFYLVTLPDNPRTLHVDLFFKHSLGNLDMNIYDPTQALIASADSTTDNESLSVDLNLVGGDYYIEVTGDDSGNHYDLIWSVEVDDAYEPNSSSSDAYDLSGSEGIRLSGGLGVGKQFDDDWFSITTTPGTIALNILVDNFDSLEGAIFLELYDDSDNLLASSTEGLESQELTAPVDPAGATYNIRVFGDDNGNAYDLLWTASTEDLYEENNFVEDAYDLTAYEGVWLSDVNGYGAQFDDDWYMIVVSTGATTLEIECTFTHADGDIDLELYRLDPTADDHKTDPSLDQRKPTLVARADSTTDNEAIAHDVTGNPGIYFIRVYYGNTGNIYNLRWDDGVVDIAGDSIFLNEDWVFADAFEPVLHAGLKAPLEDADDGVFPAWAKSAFGLKAEAGDTVKVENSIEQAEDGKQYFTISIIRSATAVAEGYKFSLEESDDLSFKNSTVIANPEYSTQDLGDGRERVTFRSSRDMTESPSGFFRVRVEPPE